MNGTIFSLKRLGNYQGQQNPEGSFKNGYQVANDFGFQQTSQTDTASRKFSDFPVNAFKDTNSYGSMNINPSKDYPMVNGENSGFNTNTPNTDENKQLGKMK